MPIHYMHIHFISTTYYRWVDSPLTQPIHFLFADIRSLSAQLVLSWTQNPTFAIKTSASYPENSQSASRLLKSAVIEIHRNFHSTHSATILFSSTNHGHFSRKIQFFSTPFYFNYIIKIILRLGNQLLNQWNTNLACHCSQVFCQ